MKAVVFPNGFLDEIEIANLSSDHKLLAVGASTHKQMLPCGVIALTNFVVTSLGFLPAVAAGVIAELVRRKIAVFDPETNEFFLLKTFHWHKTPSQSGDNSPWASQIELAITKIRSRSIRAEVMTAISVAPIIKMDAVTMPTNLLPSLPARGKGEKWTPSELLVLLCSFANPLQNASGIFTADCSALGALCSLPAATVGKILGTFDALGALIFDEDSGEIFVPARMRRAHMRELSEVSEAISRARSRRVKFRARREFSRTYGVNINKSIGCRPVELDVYFKDKKEKKAADKFPLLRRELSLLCIAASSRNQRSRPDADYLAANEALEFAERIQIDDNAAAAAVSILRLGGGWPQKASRVLRAIPMRPEIPARPMFDSENVSYLIGRTLILADRTRVPVRESGAKIGANIVSLHTIAERIATGDLKLQELPIAGGASV